ncbi:uncharacterized protein LOC115875648 isoform X1 [Sitophilus oryzae]|uniref:Uncharacterized protein LOC115875648 isoform X1 n=1 Tax=Sitophilus oryzae TaxID=7048 RepID=A0A6J2X757_SITOR|nr:uncharacterized protein LOC115875648 isoform X1 [Sitophilus oryzae]
MMEVEATIPAVPITSEAVSESTSPDVIAIPSTSKEVTSEAVSESTSPDVIAIPSTSKEVTSEDFSQQIPTSLSADSPRKHGLRLQIRSLKRKLEFHPEYSFIFFINNIYLKR